MPGVPSIRSVNKHIRVYCWRFQLIPPKSIIDHLSSQYKQNLDTGHWQKPAAHWTTDARLSIAQGVRGHLTILRQLKQTHSPPQQTQLHGMFCWFKDTLGSYGKTGWIDVSFWKQTIIPGNHSLRKWPFEWEKLNTGCVIVNYLYVGKLSRNETISVVWDKHAVICFYMQRWQMEHKFTEKKKNAGKCETRAWL